MFIEPPPSMILLAAFSIRSRLTTPPSQAEPLNLNLISSLYDH